MLVRSPMPAPSFTPVNYFLSVTAHGSLMAYVLTTFFIMGFGYFVAERRLRRPLPALGWAWAGFFVAVFGTAARRRHRAARARVRALYFLSAADGERWFYIGLVLVVAASWIWCVIMIVAMRRWKAANPGHARAARHVRDGGERGPVAVDDGRRRHRACVPGHSRGVGMGDDGRCRPQPHAVLVDAARHRLFLAVSRLHRVLHDGAGGRRRPALQRHDGPPYLRPVHRLQPAGWNAPSVHGSRSTRPDSSSCR